MTQDPRVRVDVTGGMKFEDESSGNSTTVFTEHSKLSQVAEQLAAHGGGELSVNLALDLVLNDLVERARTATGATGAAIALFRDGELTCRASSGDHAPDLGIKVDASSGLAAACVNTGEMQQCRDTDTDERVNSEVCRRLGVRSMLIAPLVDGQRLIGIIQVLSAWPNAFGKREVSALQVLAGRIAESNREAEAGISMPDLNSEPNGAPGEITPEPVVAHEVQAHERHLEEAPAAEAQEVSTEETEESVPPRKIDVWGSILVALVISVAIVLGLVIGWKKAADFTKSAAHAKVSASQSTQTPSTSSQNVAPTDITTGTQDASAAKLPAKPVAPVGGLLVTENGKVVYRSPSEATPSVEKRPTGRPLVRKVEPQYPAEARARNIQGPVVLDVQVLGDGGIGTISVISGDPLLAQSAIDAVKQWRYKPESANGQQVESQTRITVKFTLPSS